jgi:hypothetical protein
MIDVLYNDLRLLRNQIREFVGDDPDAVRTIERLISNVNVLIERYNELETRVETLESFH